MIEQGTVFGGWEDYHPKSKAPVDPVPNRSTLRTQLQSGHLPMFMTGQEIQEHYQPLYGDRNIKSNWETEDDHEVWSRKAKEAEQTPIERHGYLEFRHAQQRGKTKGIKGNVSLAEHIATKGPVAKSVHLELKKGDEKPQVLGGHHRIAISAKQFPNHLLPVEHAKSFDEAATNRNYS